MGSHPEPGRGHPLSVQAKLWLGEGWALDRCQNLPSLSLSPMGGRAKRDHSGEPGMVPVWAH